MQAPGLKIAGAVFCLALSTAATAQNEIFLTLDPSTSKPTVVAEPSMANHIVIRSLDYVNSSMPEPFIIRFGIGFVGKYQSTGGAVTPATVTSTGVVFQSRPGTYAIPGGGGNVPTQEVVIHLQPAATHPPQGYKYDVLMGAQVLDPRIRPR